MKPIFPMLMGLSIVMILGCSKSPPLKSKATSFTIGPIKVSPLINDPDEKDTEVRVLVSTQGGDCTKLNTGMAWFADSSRHDSESIERIPGFEKWEVTTKFLPAGAENKIYYSYRFSLADVPKEIGPIYFKAKLSVEDLPSQLINVLVRE